MQVLCGLQGIFLLFNCQTPGAQNNTVKQAKASMSLLAELLNNVLYSCL